MDKETVKKLNTFLVSYLKRYRYEFEFFQDVIKENAEAFDDAENLRNACERISLNIDMVLREHFEKEVIDDIEMYDGHSVTIVDSE